MNLGPGLVYKCGCGPGLVMIIVNHRAMKLVTDLARLAKAMNRKWAQ